MLPLTPINRRSLVFGCVQGKLSVFLGQLGHNSRPMEPDPSFLSGCRISLGSSDWSLLQPNRLGSRPLPQWNAAERPLSPGQSRPHAHSVLYCGIPGGNVKPGLLCNKSWPAELVRTEGALIFQSPQTLAVEDSVPGTSLYISDLLALRRQLGEDQTASR